jgi:hypothetical protein
MFAVSNEADGVSQSRVTCAVLSERAVSQCIFVETYAFQCVVKQRDAALVNCFEQIGFDCL